jgi:hypothetical protein
MKTPESQSISPKTESPNIVEKSIAHIGAKVSEVRKRISEGLGEMRHSLSSWGTVGPGKWERNNKNESE